MCKRFDVVIEFLGIFAVVPNSSKAKKFKKLALVVPMTDAKDVKCKAVAQDGKTLYRHRWFVEFNASQLVGTPADVPTTALGYLPVSEPGGFRRLTFSAGGASPISGVKALDYLCNFTELAPKFADLPSKYLKWPKGKPVVAGQVMFDIGELLMPNEIDRPQWIFPGTLRSDGSWDQPVSHRLRVRLCQVEDFEILIRSRKKGKDPARQSLKLQGTLERPEVKVVIGNLCDVNPLRWETAADPRLDDDFRWYYQVCSKKDEVADYLRGLNLPIPHPVSGEGNAIGQNCLSAKFKDQNFTLD